MCAQIIATGLGRTRFSDVLSHGIRKSRPDALGIAVAYVSASGLHYLQKLVLKHNIEKLRLVTDTKDGITHPKALASALANNWEVRVVDHLQGTFHPKLYIAGAEFDDEAGVKDVSMVLQGSANLSKSALYCNGECTYLSVSPKVSISAGNAWKVFWATGAPLTPAKLAAYEVYFASRNRDRAPADLITLGVADEEVPTENGSPAKGVAPPPDAQKTIPNTVATTAWAGLQSFTGDYNLQIEFPRDAGAVLARLLHGKGNAAGFLCEDGVTRNFIFRYYDHNGMFRLNVHNDTPGAIWARDNKLGIAAVETEGDRLHFRIIEPSRRLQNVVDRSLALGTWGRTTTRLYGWY